MAKSKETTMTVQITAPDIQMLSLRVDGTAPYMQCAFSEKAQNAIRAQQEAGSTARSKKNREAKDFDQCARDATHISLDGWAGIPAASFRAAMISACKLVGYKMTLAKLSFWVIPDGFDRVTRDPLVRIYGEPVTDIRPVRLPNGNPDMRARPLWPEWHATVSISYDAGQFQPSDVVNLMMRVGEQVGIGEGRPDSRKSAGIGFGTFKVDTKGIGT